MTPIKIRGKRGQKARLRAQKEVRTRRAAIEELHMTSSMSAVEAISARLTLDSLPTEIIESIFLYSKNLELPRSSLALGRALSSTGFKHVVLRAFLTDPYLEDDIDDETCETGDLQSAFLRCRWVDEAMFTHALHHVRTSKLAAFFQNPSTLSKSKVTDVAPHNALLGPGCPVGDTSITTIADFGERLKTQPGLLEERQWTWVSNSNEKFSLLMPDYPGRVWLGRYNSPDDEYTSSSEFVCDFQLAHGCEIPIKVLHGPWTESKVNFLHSLMNASAGLDWETSNNGEVAENSLKEAILQGNMSLLQVLLRKPNVCLSQLEIYSWPYHPSVPLTQEHLRMAIFQGGCKRDIIRMLLQRGHTNGLRLDDGDMADWAIAKDEEGDERGTWLLQEIKSWEADHIAHFQSLTVPIHGYQTGSNVNQVS
ncbi:MAG: hypothetical protein Q9166_005219 [cf. Caloplaca sp. 2 TL-2023]